MAVLRLFGGLAIVGAGGCATAKGICVFEPESRFEVGSEQIVGKVFDDEVILINLASGVYYSMDRSGGLIWSLLEGGQSIAATTAELCEHFEVSADTAGADLEALVEQLVAENLIALRTDSPSSAEPLPDRPTQKTAYVTPSLNVYNDMAALMALDPPMPGFMDSTWNDSGD